MSVTRSAHPEWDLMYRKGLTVRQIADLCGAVGATVASHLRVSKKLDPGIYHDHVLNRPGQKPGRIWLQRFSELKSFQQKYRKFPSKKSDDPEVVRLARWLTDQRAKLKAGTLSPAKRERLTEIAGWATSQRPSVDEERWQLRLQELQVFFHREGRWPRHRNSQSEHERMLGVWLHSRRQEASRGRLKGSSLKALNDAVPGWNTWRTRERELFLPEYVQLSSASAE